MSFKMICVSYLSRMVADIESVEDKISEARFEMISDSRLRPDYRLALVMDTEKILARMRRLCRDIDKLSNNIEG